VQQSDPTWPDIVEAADWLRHDLGVSNSLWGKACLTVGVNWHQWRWRLSRSKRQNISGPHPANLNIAPISGRGYPSAANAYAASKGAVIALTKTAA
jgi:NAD(P)-dependent dehydrogenase (short-subunit alcohol dehydrogenase family)